MPDEQTKSLPSISVIVPAYNAQGSIAKLLDSLLAQDYPKQLLEIIIVDNNSTDQTGEIVKGYPVTLLREKSIQSSYAARNKAIKNAKGQIFAFTDTDCIADGQWLKEGVNALISQQADIAGGKVEFSFSQTKTDAEIWDSLTYLQMESKIKNEQTAATANLFVRSSIFQTIGLFPHVKSGGDAQWTKKATSADHSLIYAEKAIVTHPARQLKQLLKKRFRTGTGYTHIRLKTNPISHELPYLTFRAIFVPIPKTYVASRLQQTGEPELKAKFLRVLAIAYLCKIFERLGALTELTRILAEKVKLKVTLK